MNRRIEVLIDTEDLSEFTFAYLRQRVEDQCWEELKTISRKGFVQANEVPAPIIYEQLTLAE